MSKAVCVRERVERAEPSVNNTLLVITCHVPATQRKTVRIVALPLAQEIHEHRLGDDRQPTGGRQCGEPVPDRVRRENTAATTA